MIDAAPLQLSVWQKTGVVVYGVSLILMFLASTQARSDSDGSRPLWSRMRSTQETVRGEIPWAIALGVGSKPTNWLS